MFIIFWYIRKPYGCHRNVPNKMLSSNNPVINKSTLCKSIRARIKIYYIICVSDDDIVKGDELRSRIQTRPFEGMARCSMSLDISVDNEPLLARKACWSLQFPRPSLPETPVDI